MNTTDRDKIKKHGKIVKDDLLKMIKPINIGFIQKSNNNIHVKSKLLKPNDINNI